MFSNKRILAVGFLTSIVGAAASVPLTAYEHGHVPSADQPSASGPPSISIVHPVVGAKIRLGGDLEKAVGVVVRAENFTLKAAGQCGGAANCGHLHMKIDPQGDNCNQPGKPYNSRNSEHGGQLIQANFGYCATPTGLHVIGILLANDNHSPVLIDGKPVTALVSVETE